jgi:glycosyltransferase involved in cell wall biosynthesis
MAAPRMLIINGFYPTPDVDSGSISITNFMRMAMKLGFDVAHMVPRDFTPAAAARVQLEGMGVRVVGAPQHRSPEAFLETHGSRFAVVVLSIYYVAGPMYALVRARCPNARVIFNAVDMHHIRHEREAKVTGSADAARRAEQARGMELALVRQCDGTIVVSETERDRLLALIPGARVFYIPLIRDIPGRINGYRERADVAFVGHYRHPPNPDAVLAFAALIWPHIHSALPDARFKMIGDGWPPDHPPPAGEAIDIVGHVADMTASLEGLRLTVAPLRFGAGAKGKIVTSLAHGVPCVATPIGAEGMGFTDGVDILISSSPADFAAKVVALYRDEALWTRMSDAGIAFVKRNHSFEHGVALVRSMLDLIGVRLAA